MGANAQRVAGHQRHTDFNPNFRPVEKMAMAKANPQYKLANIISDDEWEETYFSYNSQNQLVAVKDMEALQYDIYDSMRYNSKGQLVTIECWQLLQGKYKKVNYVEFTYDDNGNIATRRNFNDIGGWQQGGLYRYTYNANNQIIRSELTLGTGDELFQLVEYYYQDGKLKDEVWSIQQGWGVPVTYSEKLSYTYNANGRYDVVYDSVYDGGLWYYDGKDTYEYDNNGNCTQTSSYNAYNHETQRSVFTFESPLMENTLMPWTPEMDQPRACTYANKNIYSQEEFWQLDADNELQHLCDYIFTYLPISSPNGIENLEGNTFQVSPNPASESIVLQGVEENLTLSVIDMAGRTLMNQKLQGGDNTIDISSLQSGVYVLRLSNGKTSKLMVK